MKYKLAIIPEGYKVVPVEPIEVFSCGPWTFEETGQRFNGSELNDAAYAMYASHKQPDTPPALRWELNIKTWELYYFDAVIAIADDYGWNSMTKGSGSIRDNPQEARRAAEKALGFPDGLVIEEV